MFNSILAKFLGSQNDRYLKKTIPVIEIINSFEPAIKSLSDEQLKDKTAEFRSRHASGESLDDLMPEAFAAVREASKRSLGMRHYDVQLIGGKVLHEGRIAEMKTGEGKTLVATLAAYLNAIPGKGVHIVTVNDYLARRDAEWMSPVYNFMGMNVGSIQHDMPETARKEAYGSDITYGTNNEFGFDYLRDNMKYNLQDCVQPGHSFAIVDEVDSILIDEARTPLIISGPSDESTDKYYKIDRLIPRLVREEDFKVDEKMRTVVLQETGIEKSEKALGLDNLYDPRNMELVHHIQQALKAHTLFTRDKDYVVKEGEVIIVDEFTGRMMPGRRYSDGLHQALEAKEGVKIERENQTLATITFQNYFRMYDKLSGMTGTAETEAAEFEGTYELQTVVIPTNQNLIRVEFPDVIFRTQKEKFEAVADEIKELSKRGQPVLVGTTSIEKSERLSSLLKKKGTKHFVLNAKYHQKEAQIIENSGRKGAVTIATNMAGRGTDIILGGKPGCDLNKLNIFDNEGLDALDTLDEGGEQAESTDEQRLAEYEAWKKLHDDVIALGGLHIIGTERHEARRIDNQLRGRAGRQGDPGSSRFYLSLEDDLLRIFGSENIAGIMQRLGMEEGVPIESRLISKQIERAQSQVEARNFDIRKHLLEYDDVMNKQREEIYSFRHDLLEDNEQKQYVLDMAEELMFEFLDTHASPDVDPKVWNYEDLEVSIKDSFGLEPPEEVAIPEGSKDAGKMVPWKDLSREELEDTLLQAVKDKYDQKELEFKDGFMRWFERMIILQIIDQQWKDHLLALDHLKEGIGLRGYGQRDPKMEYKRESFELFADLRVRMRDQVVKMLFLLQPAEEEEKSALSPKAQNARRAYNYSGGEGDTSSVSAYSSPGVPQQKAPAQGQVQQQVRQVPKVGRNDPCPCGSGRKYKHCCGKS
jgi:preprotein translocase subunit SecA